ncbi:MAG: hypothetical protein DCF16_15660 [Alphaproteobacteria bacterium]|nr:MAG: hypothetical protein DCF16_15660 [Alphaproteobacteria bacterium]
MRTVSRKPRAQAALGFFGELRVLPGRFRALGDVWPLACSMPGEIQEKRQMTVPARYILAAIAFGVAALGLFLLPTDAAACGADGCRRPPPTCQSGCNTPPPPPVCCERPTVVVPPPHVPPPNIVVVNAGARAAASASATAIAIANVRTGDTIIRSNTIVEAGASAAATSSAFSITEGSVEMESVTRERDLLVQAICIDSSGNPHPASQTFGGRAVAQSHRGELYRCMAGTRMRYTMDGRSYDCEPGQALWYENGAVECRAQIARRQCNERSLLRRFGPGDKLIRIRDTETREAIRETQFQGTMIMDGGVGQGVY